MQDRRVDISTKYDVDKVCTVDDSAFIAILRRVPIETDFFGFSILDAIAIKDEP
jgi:hypothetical protein